MPGPEVGNFMILSITRKELDDALGGEKAEMHAAQNGHSQ